MYVSPSCYKVQRFFKHFVTDDDVGNIETCRNLFKKYELPSTFYCLIYELVYGLKLTFSHQKSQFLWQSKYTTVTEMMQTYRTMD